MGIFDWLKKKTKGDPIEEQQVTVAEKNAPKTKNAVKETVIVDGVEISTLESLIKNAYPSKSGLFPHEIMMLDYANTYSIHENHFQNFWKWEYSVLEPQKILDSLFDRGFICIEDINSTLHRLSVVRLKDILKKFNGKTTGKKDELISRILEIYNEEELETELSERNYALTELGKTELAENEYVPYAHRNRYMNVWDINRKLYSDNPSHLKFRDIIWRELNERSGEYFRKFEFGSYRGTRLSMHNFLLEEDKYKTAFALLCEVLSFDLSGLGNEHAFIRSKMCKKDLKVSRRLSNFYCIGDKKEILLYPGIVKAFAILYEKLGMTKAEFILFTRECLAEIKIAERIFDEEECANFILSELGLEERKVFNTYEVAKNRLMKMYGME